MKQAKGSRGWRHGLIESLESRQLLSSGALDLSFSGDGKMNTTFDTVSVRGTGMAVQSDGKIVEVGKASGNQFAVVRYNADGTLDTTFGGNGTGKFTAHVGDADEPSNTAYAVAIQADGKIIVVGGIAPRFPGIDGEAFIVRLKSNGTFDTSFSDDGVVGLGGFDSQFSGNAVARAVFIQKNGQILIAGSEYQALLNPNDNFVVARLNTNGSLDKSFSTNGLLSLDWGDDEEVEAMSVDYNGTASTNPNYGKIVLVGHSTSDDENSVEVENETPHIKYKMVVARLNTNGTLDNSFNGDGKIITDGGTHKSTDSRGMVIEADNSIVVAGDEGTDYGSKDHNFTLFRFTSKGKLDTSFGNNGITVTDFGGDDRATSLIVGGYGQRLIAGGRSNGAIALSAYDLNGHLETNFGTNGKVTTQFGNDASRVHVGLSLNHTIVAEGGGNFNTARYFDVFPKVSVTALDPIAGEPMITKLGRVIIRTPNPGSLLVSRDMVLPFATRVFFTISGSAKAPTVAAVKTQSNDYTLSGMTLPLSPIASGTLAYVDIPANEAFATVTLTPVDDTAIEPTETAGFLMKTNALYDVNPPGSSVITLLDNDSTTPVAQNFTATADTYVKDGSADAGKNFGTEAQLVVKKSATVGSNRQAYLKFDLSSISSANSVKLNLFGALNNTDQASLMTQVFSVADTSWLETGMTFNLKRAPGASPLASATILGTTPQLYTFDVTAYVQQQLAAHKNVVSFAIINPNNSSPAILFNSREAASNKPTLVVT